MQAKSLFTCQELQTLLAKETMQRCGIVMPYGTLLTSRMSIRLLDDKIECVTVEVFTPDDLPDDLKEEKSEPAGANNGGEAPVGAVDPR